VVEKRDVRDLTIAPDEVSLVSIREEAQAAILAAVKIQPPPEAKLCE
jgi:hypothetical protein